MSYYILPKNNNNIEIRPIIENKTINIILSFSVYYFYNDLHNQLIELLINQPNDISFNKIEQIYKEFNPHEYIFSKVPGSKYSVSKLKTKSNLFYEFFEIFNTLNCFDILKNINLKAAYFGNNYSDITDCFDLLRENKEDSIVRFNENILFYKDKYEFIIFELDNLLLEDLNKNINLYIIYLIKNIIKILNHQQNNGICIIQLTHLFHLPIVELIYIISSLFEKIYVIKPNSSNITDYSKYLVCKYFINNESKAEIYKYYTFKLNELLLYYYKNSSTNIISILNISLPYYFLNKIDDINVIIGQQQLECFDQIINIFKNNANKKERLDYIRKINIQKAVHWCEKFKIPCNKFLEKTNIFLPIEKVEV
jgi:hypothetical protein